MSHTIDYYLAPQSPWTYLGHSRFQTIAQEAKVSIRVLPMDLGKVFPVSGGLPLGQRAPQRQAYRLVELARFRDALQMPLNIKPQFFPVAGDDASRLIIAVDMTQGAQAAMAITGAILAAVWSQERNIADPEVLQTLLREHNLPATCWEASKQSDVQARYEQNTQNAIDAQVFGSPSYVVNGEIFWGQDRLDLLAKRLLV
jgi:2-hydroxychromene-2-carboxylate isomerase